jgi:lysophospholipase L1-like esterase
MRTLSLVLGVWGIVATAGGRAAELPRAAGAYVAVGTLPSADATQAAAADARFVYAVSDSRVARYDRATGKELATSTGAAQHLNSAYLWQGRLYCAHSNFPRKPDRSDLRVLDPETMRLTVFHAFAEPPGSLTWAVRKGDDWWCHFAHYGADKARSVLVRFDADWKELGRWTYPAELVADWGAYSLSGGIWQGDRLLATGHDKQVIYRLRVPADGKVVEVVDVVRSPFPGQGIAADPKTGGLVGVDRARRAVVFAEYRAQAAAPAAKGPNLKRFEKDIERFEQQDRKSPPPADAVVFTGSSSIARWKTLAKDFPGLPVVNRGFGGSTLPEVNHYLDRIVLKHKPRTVVLFCGSNDMAAGRTPEQVLADFRTFCRRVHAELPKTRIVYLSIHLPPGRLKQADNIKRANRLIAAECARDKRLAYVNVHDLMLGADGRPNPELYADPLHPNARAYKLWAENLAPVLK